MEVAGTASNGRLALAKFSQLHPDVVLLDIEMPEMDGLEAVVELRKRDRHVPIIMFSTLTERGASAALERCPGEQPIMSPSPVTGTWRRPLIRVLGRTDTQNSRGALYVPDGGNEKPEHCRAGFVRTGDAANDARGRHCSLQQ